jgi:hypothetical protein
MHKAFLVGTKWYWLYLDINKLWFARWTFNLLVDSSNLSRPTISKPAWRLALRVFLCPKRHANRQQKQPELRRLFEEGSPIACYFKHENAYIEG